MHACMHTCTREHCATRASARAARARARSHPYTDTRRGSARTHACAESGARARESRFVNQRNCSLLRQLNRAHARVKVHTTDHTHTRTHTHKGRLQPHARTVCLAQAKARARVQARAR
eukprot:6191997-Pleurochrysis_carterae.AAC.3